METFIYNNPKLRRRCIGFSYLGCVLLKTLFKQNKMNCKVQVKRYVINRDDDKFSPYHYYIEVKTSTGKMIIDNQGSYNYWWYMDRYKPRGTIEKVGYRLISKAVKDNSIGIENVIENTIKYHFENIKRFHKKIDSKCCCGCKKITYCPYANCGGKKGVNMCEDCFT